MSALFFSYTLGLLILCVLAGSTALCAYLVSHQRLYFFAIFLFVFYLMDVGLIFQSEFIAQNLVFDTSTFYSITTPELKIFFGGGFLLTLQYILDTYLDTHSRLWRFGPIVIFLVISNAITLIPGDSALKQFSFYSIRQLYMLAIVVHVLVAYIRESDAHKRARLQKHIRLYITFVILMVIITLEDSLMILYAQPSWFVVDFPLYLSERNFSENILIIVLAASTIYQAEKTLKLRFEHPPTGDRPSTQIHIEEGVQSYGDKYQLSNREREILRLVLMGTDNQNIASSLHLALGTVKVHIHNILKKTGQPTRNALIQDFWKD